jgi:hypothetical protein
VLHVLRQPRVAAFALTAALIYAVAIGLVAALPRLRHPDLMVAALTIDLTIMVPFLYFLMIPRQRRWAGVLPAFLLSLLGAGLVLPESSRAALPVLRLLVVPAEVATVVLVIGRVRRGLTEVGVDGDILARLETALASAVPTRRLAHVLAYEMGVLHYGLLSWRDQPPGDNGYGRAFSYHGSGSYGAIVFAVLIVSSCEILGVHLVASRASHTAAWLLTGLGIYGVVWILGDFQAARLRPFRVGPYGFNVRFGLRWSLTIPRDEIASIAPAPKPPLPKRAPGHLHAALVTPPQWQLVLRRPLVAQGPYGITKAVTTVAVAADDRDGFRQALVEQGLLL